MQLNNCYEIVLLPLLFGSALLAQGPKLTVSEPAAVNIKRGGTAELNLKANLSEGFHANSHTPAEENLIPLKLTWEPGAVSAKDVTYPKPKMEKYEFSDKPLSVVSGNFDISTKFMAPASATTGPSTLIGKLRYQACNDRACFPPKTVEIKVPVVVK